MKKIFGFVLVLASAGCLESAIEAPSTNNQTQANNGSNNHSSNNVTTESNNSTNGTNNATTSNNSTNNLTVGNNATNNVTNGSNNATNNDPCAQVICNQVTGPRCTAGACLSCRNDDDCDQFTDTRYCQNGVCGACSVESEETVCNGTVCVIETLTCNTMLTGQQQLCQPCVSSSDCSNNMACVAHNGENFCIQRFNSANCFFPFSRQDGVSIEGAPKSLCGLENITEGCRTYLIFGTDCMTDNDCGSLKCDTAGENRCTYACPSGSACPPGWHCNGTDQSALCEKN